MTVSTDFKANDAGSYDEVADTFDNLAHRYAGPQARFLAQAIDINSRKHVIDMGCGTGLVTFQAATASGPETTLTGVDLSRGMLAEARKKAEKAGLANRVTFKTGDAEALDFPDDCADGFLSLYAFSHFPHPDKAAIEAYRVLAPGGRLAVAIGSGPQLMTYDGVRRAAAAMRRKWGQMRGRELTACDQIDRLVRKHLPAVSEGKVADWAAAQRDVVGLLDGLFRAAGFVDCRRDWVGTDYNVSDIEDFWTLQTTISTFARKHIAAATPAQYTALKDAFCAECAAVLQADGKLSYSVGAAVISGRKPH